MWAWAERTEMCMCLKTRWTQTCLWDTDLPVRRYYSFRQACNDQQEHFVWEYFRFMLVKGMWTVIRGLYICLFDSWCGVSMLHPTSKPSALGYYLYKNITAILTANINSEKHVHWIWLLWEKLHIIWSLILCVKKRVDTQIAELWLRLYLVTAVYFSSLYISMFSSDEQQGHPIWVTYLMKYQQYVLSSVLRTKLSRSHLKTCSEYKKGFIF